MLCGQMLSAKFCAKPARALKMKMADFLLEWQFGAVDVFCVSGYDDDDH